MPFPRAVISAPPLTLSTNHENRGFAGATPYSSSSSIFYRRIRRRAGMSTYGPSRRGSIPREGS
jgi:hypothetical protein